MLPQVKLNLCLLHISTEYVFVCKTRKVPRAENSWFYRWHRDLIVCCAGGRNRLGFTMADQDGLDFNAWTINYSLVLMCGGGRIVFGFSIWIETNLDFVLRGTEIPLGLERVSEFQTNWCCCDLAHFCLRDRNRLSFRVGIGVGLTSVLVWI